MAVVPLHGWSSHVGEVRVIVDPDRRGRGIGRALARRAVLEAVELDLRKMVVEVVADQEPTIAMFRSLGFDPEALLTDHVRDQSGALRDLMILAHSVEEQWSSMAVAGHRGRAVSPRVDEILEAAVNGYEDMIRQGRATCSATLARALPHGPARSLLNTTADLTRDIAAVQLSGARWLLDS